MTHNPSLAQDDQGQNRTRDAAADLSDAAPVKMGRTVQVTMNMPPQAPSTQSVDRAATPADLLGTVGDYELLAQVAQGGMGVVYKARQKSLGRLVALKMIRDDYIRSPLAVQRFYQEARAVAALDHPNIVPIFEIGQHEGHHYFTMAYVDGGSVQERLRPGEPLSVELALSVLVPVVDAMAYAHQHGIIHRDLKPHNILLDASGRPRVADFGLARQLESDVQLTSTGQIVGTPWFMSPEQALGGSRRVGPQTDVYALGAILYILLSGEPPFQGETMTEIIHKVLTEPVPELRRLNPQVPEKLASICRKCLEKKPEDRYPTARELGDALQQFQAPGSIDAQRGIPTVLVVPSTSPMLQTQPPFETPAPDKESLPTPTPAPVPTPAPPPPSPPEPRRFPLKWAAILLLVVGAGVAGFFGAREFFPGDPEKSPLAFPVPSPDRRDFGLSVEMLSKVPLKNGIYRFRAGDPIELRITVARDAHVGVWTLNADGTIVQLFPNHHDKDTQFKANVSRVIPSKSRFVATASPYAEELRVIASEKAWDGVQPRGVELANFPLFDDPEEREEWAVDVRGVLVLPPQFLQGSGVSEEALLYHVGKPLRR